MKTNPSNQSSALVLIFFFFHISVYSQQSNVIVPQNILSSSDNIASLATVTTSSTSSAYNANGAIDGVVGGFPGDISEEWAADAKGVGETIRLTWNSSQSIDRIILFDRPNLKDHITAGKLTFSSGAVIVIGQLTDDATSGKQIQFSAQTETWVEFEVTGVRVASNIGLAEFAVYKAGTDLNLQTVDSNDAVSPIDWTRFNNPIRNNSLSNKVRQISNTALKFVLNNEIDTLPDHTDGMYLFANAQFGSGHEYSVRPPSQAITILGIALQLDIYDESIVGKPKTEAIMILKKLVKSVAMRHASNGADYRWGNCWQCAHWAFMAGVGAWISWDFLDQTERNAVSNMIITEANNFDKDPPYCNDCTNDTKAEENAWNVNVVNLALAMMPNHANATVWDERGKQWLISSYARESDLQRDTIVDGKPVKDYITGWNMREEGYVYNHDRIHPDYMGSALHQLMSPVVFFLADQKIPQAAFWNMNIVYDNLVDYEWDPNLYQAPGGTIYRRDQDSLYARVYYPQGNDWTDKRIDPFFMLDIQTYTMGLDFNASTPGVEWAEVRADFLIWMQSRTQTGQLYNSSDNFAFFPPRESMVASWFAYAYLNLFLSNQVDWGKEEYGFSLPTPESDVVITAIDEEEPPKLRTFYQLHHSSLQVNLPEFVNYSEMEISDITGKVIKRLPIQSSIVYWQFTSREKPNGVLFLHVKKLDGTRSYIGKIAPTYP